MRVFATLVIFSGLQHLSAQTSSSLNSNTFGEIKARHIGSATMSGRISALDAVASNPDILYIGTAGGGLWKTENGGIKVSPVFDDYTQSIGAIAIDQLHLGG